MRIPAILLASLLPILLSGCGGNPPKIDFPPGYTGALIYGQVIKKSGSASHVVIQGKGGGSELEYSTWSSEGENGLFIIPVDSGSYTIRRKGGTYRVGGGMYSDVHGNLQASPIYQGKTVEDRSEQTEYFDKVIRIPAGKIVFIGTLKTVEKNSIEVYYDKKDVDKAVSKAYPDIDFSTASEIFPE